MNLFADEAVINVRLEKAETVVFLSDAKNIFQEAVLMAEMAEMAAM